MNNGCRHCGLPLKHSLCDLGMAPLANSYLSEAQVGEAETFYPLHARICSECLLVQVAEFDPPTSTIDNCGYSSPCSTGRLEDANAFARHVIGRFSLDRSTQVLEIASNNGHFLKTFVAVGIPAMGVEPAEDVAAVARHQGIPTEVALFGSDVARRLVSYGRSADLLVGRDVLARVSDLNDVVAGMSIVLAPNGVIIMSFPHVLNLITQNKFDTINHDHVSYFSLLTLSRVFAANGLRIFDVEQADAHGRSLRIYACHARFADHETASRVRDVEDAEREAHLDSLEGYVGYPEEVQRVKRSLLRFLIEARDLGYTTVAYGAPDGGGTLLNYCGIRDDLIDYTVDRSPYNQGRFLPGTHLPIYPPSRVRETRPDYLLILPSSLTEEIMDEMSCVRQWGARFVVPIPELAILA